MTPRTLVVTHTYPWPAIGGGAIRMARTLAALERRGPVDVVCILHREAAAARRDTSAPGVERLLVVSRPSPATGPLARAVWLVRGRLPTMRSADYGPVRTEVGPWIAERRYDLVWLGCGTEGFVALSPVLPTDVPVVANLDDLEDDKIASRLAAETAAGAARGPWGRWRPAAVATRLRDRLEVRRWRRLHATMAEAVARVVVCSDDDRQRLRDQGAGDAVVVPNVYPAPERPLGRLAVGSPPTLTLIGTLDYRPNADAAEVMVRQVLPTVRRAVPDAELRLVGRAGRGTAELARSAGVVATGMVDDIDAELARADVAVVPIRFGSGTRIKILEAFAHRIPVVSTTMGAAGLAVVDGRELLIADEPVAFATACVTLLRDEVERERLVTAAERHWQERYRPEALERVVDELVDELVPPAPASGG